MNDVDRGYIASLIDNKAELSLKRSGDGKYYSVILRITSTCASLITYLRSTTNMGRVDELTTGDRWCLRIDEAKKLLTEVLPYLITKKERAEKMLKFINNLQRKRFGERLTERDIIERDLIYQEVISSSNVT